MILDNKTIFLEVLEWLKYNTGNLEKAIINKDVDVLSWLSRVKLSIEELTKVSNKALSIDDLNANNETYLEYLDNVKYPADVEYEDDGENGY